MARQKDTRKLLTFAQCARRLGIATELIHYHVRHGNLQATPGSVPTFFIAEEELNRFLNWHSQPQQKGKRRGSYVLRRRARQQQEEDNNGQE